MLKFFFRILLGSIFVFLLLPIIFVILSSLSASPLLNFPPTSFTTAWYGRISPPFWAALRYSLYVGLAVTVIITPLGTGIALAIARWRGLGRGVFSTMVLSPLMIPPLVIGAALFQSSVTFRSFTGVGLTGNAYAIIIGHCVLSVPLVIRSVLAAHAHFNPHLEEASLSLGATPSQTFMRITLRGLLPGITAGAIFAFLFSLDDVAIALFVGPGDIQTLPVAIFRTLEYAFDPSIMAVSSVLIFGIFALAMIVHRLIGLDVVFGLKGR